MKRFEQRLYDLGKCRLEELLQFLKKEQCELMQEPDSEILQQAGRETIKSFLKVSQNGFRETPSTKYIGDPLGCDLQLRKTARRSKKTTPFRQRFHIRLYIFEREFIIVSETETDPHDPPSSAIHLLEGRGSLATEEGKGYPKPEHRIIRLQRARFSERVWAFLRGKKWKPQKQAKL